MRSVINWFFSYSQIQGENEMRWRQGQRSQNIEDRRGRGGKKAVSLGGGATVMIVIASLLFGLDPSKMLALVGGGAALLGEHSSTPQKTSTEEEEVKDFLSAVLADTEQVWTQLYAQSGGRYVLPTLVLYRDSTPTACGEGQAAAGPFYCPGDKKLYLDLGFLNELKRMGAEGDFALAYVIAHEVGHHVQNLEGTLNQVHIAKQSVNKVDANKLQVMTELQADCFAGVWAHHAQKQRQILEAGDIEEGMQAAASVGDDHLQRQAGRRVVPEAFTHGSSKQRQQWLYRGLNHGEVAQCNTFNQS